MKIRNVSLAALGAAGSVAVLLASGALSAGEAINPPRLPAPPSETPQSTDQVAVLAGGCFWGIEGLFEHVKGVKSVLAGYAGGTKETATYRKVATETTGHAETVRIVYDPKVVSYGTLLKIFFSVAHDPTQVNRQFPDTGPSYRSAIFPQNSEQKRIAASYIASLDRAKVFGKPIATKIETGAFYPAERYHQDFMRRNPGNSYTTRYDKPKIAALKNTYPALYKS